MVHGRLSFTLLLFLAIRCREMVSQVPVDGVATLEQSIAILSKRIDNLLTKHLSQTDQRIMIALAGVPGSGKSTVSTQLLRSLRKRGIDNVMAVPMVSLFDHPGKVPAD
jgi:putative protein kinase ArgK-like GTPase of G3E family